MRTQITQIEQIIDKQSGVSFKLKKGQYLKVTDPQGGQVSDMVLFNENDVREKISSGKTLDFEESILISTSNYLWSNRSNKMMLVLEDTNGRNDFLLAPCSLATFKIMYDIDTYHPSCFENLEMHLKQFDINADDIPTAFNIFMNVQFDEAGKLSVKPPLSIAGDFILFEAQMDLIVGLTACSAEDSNGGTFKPIKFEIIG
ncbi:urea carboxylase-associated family protein [Marivirga sp.]|uniref:urea carboxylase-associated family protein n=1 Tax=Marivirga sp. TaxID=2018662 RepID=UPI0025E697EA|nr:urea carboxylase-associated family protein [Marivirga sp.]